MRLAILAVSLTCLAAACGDDGASADGGPDAALTDAGPPDGAGARCTCLAAAADFSAGTASLATITLPERTVATNVLPGAATNDPILRYDAASSRAFVVNRVGNAVTVIDTATMTVTSQFSTGAGTNPQDLAVNGTTAYVVLYDQPGVQVWDLSAPNPAAPTSTIDLAPFVDAAEGADTNPDAASIYIQGPRAYVTLQHLDRTAGYAPVAPGSVVVIDLGTGTAQASTLTLHTRNPFGLWQKAGNQLVVGTVNFADTSGCIERLTPSGPTVNTCLADNSALEGYANGIAPVGTDLYVTADRFGGAGPEGRLRRVSATGVVGPNLTPATEIPGDVAYCAATNQLLYTDSSSGGVRVWDLTTGAEATTDALSIGLPAVASGGLVCF